MVLKHWAHNGFKVGPEYCPPVEPVASQWIDYTDPRVISSPADLSAWWTTFNDPVLNDLVQTAQFPESHPAGSRRPYHGIPRSTAIRSGNHVSSAAGSCRQFLNDP